MSTSSKKALSNKDEQIFRQKYLVVDDEIVKNENDKEDFILDIGVSEDLALFATNYEEALRIVNLHSDIAICFIDFKIPKNESSLYDFNPSIQNTSSEWGISLIPEINRVHKNTSIIVYSAYVTKTYLKSKVSHFNNVKGFFGKPEGVKHRKELYLDAVRTSLSPPRNKKKAAPTPNTFDYSELDANLLVYLHQKAAGIKQLVRRSAQDLVDIGQSLIDVKNKLEYGQFYAWLETEFSWSYRTAHRFMRVAQTFESDKLSDLDILPSALYELSAPSIPKAATIEALDRAEQGETISIDVAKEIKSKYLATDRTSKTTTESSTTPVQKQTNQAQLPNSESLTTDNLHGRLMGRGMPWDECHRVPQATQTPQVNSVTANPKAIQPEIISIIRQENVWQLGKHLLFCGEPNSPEFIKHLPAKISLNLAFPIQKNWLFMHEQVDSTINFYSKYEQDLDVGLLSEAVERLIKITTDDGDDLTICFIPHPDILLLAHRLGCRCFIAEPDRRKCEAVRAAWSASD